MKHPKIYKFIANWNEGECNSADAYLVLGINNFEYDFGGEMTYEWTIPDGSIEITTEQQLLVKESCTYDSKDLSPLLCDSESTSIDVIYNPIPEITLSTSWNQELCINEKAFIEASIVNSEYDFGGDLKFEWTLPSGKTQITTETRLEIIEKGTYTVKAITPLVCESEVTSLTIDFNL